MNDDCCIIDVIVPMDTENDLQDYLLNIRDYLLKISW